METLTLLDLAPVLAAVIGPMLAAVLVMMRYQHVDSAKTHKLLTDTREEFRELIGEARDEFRTLNDEARDEARTLNDETCKLIERRSREHSDGLREMASSLGDARERLARIEGHLGIGMRPSLDTGDNEADAA